jgi:pimeloyl-ACP methyl ester carboxylesterase
LVVFSLDIGAVELSRTRQGPCHRAAHSAPVQSDTQATELVDVRTADRLLLTGLFAAAGSAAPPRRFDAALLMHGAATSYDEGFQREFSAALGARGLPTVRAGNRGHDIVNWGDGRGRLLGTAFERVDDCVLDWRAWLDFLEVRGYRRVLLFGHSLGAVKCAYYLAHEPDARVAGCVLASPPRFNTERMLACERGDELAATLTAAQALVAAGRPDDIVHTTFPLASISGARAYIAPPVLALTGERELGDPLFRDHPGDYDDARARKPDIEHAVIAGGDHHYRRVRDVAIAKLLAWIDAG